MSLLFTLLHAHRCEPRNISITIHAHLLGTDAASSSLRLSLVRLYPRRSRARSLLAAVPFFQRLFLRLSCSLAAIRLNTFVYDIPRFFFPLALAPAPLCPRLSLSVPSISHYLSLFLSLIESFLGLSFSIFVEKPYAENVSLPFFRPSVIAHAIRDLYLRKGEERERERKK